MWTVLAEGPKFLECFGPSVRLTQEHPDAMAWVLQASCGARIRLRFDELARWLALLCIVGSGHGRIERHVVTSYSSNDRFGGFSLQSRTILLGEKSISRHVTLVFREDDRIFLRDMIIAALESAIRRD